ELQSSGRQAFLTVCSVNMPGDHIIRSQCFRLPGFLNTVDRTAQNYLWGQSLSSSLQEDRQREMKSPGPCFYRRLSVGMTVKRYLVSVTDFFYFFCKFLIFRQIQILFS